jgi:hypothetical protein
MAVPTISSLATETTGAPATGGAATGYFWELGAAKAKAQEIEIKGANFGSEAAKLNGIKFGPYTCTSFKWESSTAIAKVVVPPAFSFTKGWTTGEVAPITVITTEGSNVVEAGAEFVYYPATTTKHVSGVTIETIAYGEVAKAYKYTLGSGSTEENSVSYLTHAGAEKGPVIPLVGNFSACNTFYLEVNPTAVSGEAKATVQLQGSWDGGVSFEKLGTDVKSAATGAAKTIVRVEAVEKEKALPPQFRLVAESGAAGKTAFVITVVGSVNKTF